MNWLVLLFLVILAGNIYQGYKKGFLRVTLSLVSWILVIIVANAFAPQLTEFIISETSIDETIIQSIHETVTKTIENIEIEQPISNIEQQLPTELRELLLGDNTSIQEIIPEMLTQDIVQTEKIMPYISGALQILCTIILFIVMRIAIFVADKLLAIASHLPLIGSTDKFLGLAVGLIKGVLFTWILMTIITFVAMIKGEASLVNMIHESQILTWLYENNVILNLIIS